jgi:hypothetical protein
MFWANAAAGSDCHHGLIERVLAAINLLMPLEVDRAVSRIRTDVPTDAVQTLSCCSRCLTCTTLWHKQLRLVVSKQGLKSPVKGQLDSTVSLGLAVNFMQMTAIRTNNKTCKLGGHWGGRLSLGVARSPLAPCRAATDSALALIKNHMTKF